VIHNRLEALYLIVSNKLLLVILNKVLNYISLGDLAFPSRQLLRMKLLIKNMVCQRCETAVRSIIQELHLSYNEVVLGEIDIPHLLTNIEYKALADALAKSGFELITDRNEALVEQIRKVVRNMVRDEDTFPDTNFSYYLSARLRFNYTYLANLFSKVSGGTIEQFIISHKIERVKELLRYEELSLTAIAFKLHYSSVAHLSNQFKKVTGFTPTLFRRQQRSGRLSIDHV